MYRIIHNDRKLGRFNHIPLLWTTFLTTLSLDENFDTIKEAAAKADIVNFLNDLAQKLHINLTITKE